MSPLIRPLALVLCVASTCAAAIPYRGFIINETKLGPASNRTAIEAATKDQIDIVCSVGIAPKVLAFFQSVPSDLVPAGTIRSPTPGFYAGRSVKVAANIVRTGHKPVLLHELLHAFHQQRLRGGFDNREVAEFYEQARAGRLFPPSHMMQNQREYFACAATTYLFGATAQEPFTREKLKAAQPALYAWLASVFGPTTGSYAGSLTSAND